MEKQAEKCQCHGHPIPTAAEQDQMNAALVEAVRAINRASGIASRTPAYHWLADDLGLMMPDLIRLLNRLQRIACVHPYPFCDIPDIGCPCLRPGYEKPEDSRPCDCDCHLWADED